ncbi:MAG: hypothetical protein H8E73_01835 [Planctomycetes bacterium]|nr:hypothetical protein [Planctomycetota bacterium]
MDKILGFLEEHVEKMVLGIVGIVCIWLLVAQVVFSPNAISFDGQGHNPGAIDDYIREQAAELEAVLNQRPAAPNAYEPRLGEYRAVLKSSITGVDFGISPAVPESNPQGGTIVRKYNLPEIGGIDNVVAGQIRAVAYTPFEEVTTERVYDGAGSEPNDLDFVTVQGSYDIAGLYARCADSFAGAGVKPEWRDPCLAEPVFAAVHVQRQEQSDNGLWSEWEDVPRTKIDHHRELFTIIEDARSLPPGGLTVRMLQHGDRAVQADLLQPAAYKIASANEEWFPPLLHEEYRAIRASEALEERRRAKEEEEEQKDSSSDTSRRRRSSATTGGGLTSSLYAGGGGRESQVGGGRTSSGRRTSSRTGGGSTSAYGTGQQSQEGGRYANRSRTSRSRTGQEESSPYGRSSLDDQEASARPTVEDVYAKLEAISITQMADLRTLEELIFWAHDDTVEPGKTYRYRVRLGVFNSVAGKNQLSQRDAARNNEVVLWSNFSDVSQAVEVPRRLYFFAKGIQEAAKEVTVQVSKYVLGHWHSEDFKVKSGEVIGDFVVTKVAKKTPALSVSSSPYGSGRYAVETVAEPEAVDYDTGAVLVDVVAVNDWSGDKTMRARSYFDMLYSYDGASIERMPIGDRYWPAELQAVRGEIRNSQKEPKVALRDWGSVGTGIRGGAERAGVRRNYSLYRTDRDY